MSTEYNLIPVEELKEGHSITVWEHSNKFDICITNDIYTEKSISDLSLEQLIKVRDRLSQIIEYFI